MTTNKEITRDGEGWEIIERLAQMAPIDRKRPSWECPFCRVEAWPDTPLSEVVHEYDCLWRSARRWMGYGD